MVYLKKINLDIGYDEYMMYQEIPISENGATNILHGKTFEEFYKLVENKVNEEFIELNDQNTPRISYIMYDNEEPIGEMAIRPLLNEYWMKVSGNIGYKIRPSKRNLGYGNKILALALEECKKMNMKEVILQCYSFNDISRKVILNNNGILIEKDNNIEIYKVIIV